MGWKLCAILSAVFASLTALFAKIGVREINSNLATAILDRNLGFCLGNRL